MYVSLTIIAYGPIKLVCPRHFVLKCLHQVRKVSDHVFVLRVSILSLSVTFQVDLGTVPTMSYFLLFILLSNLSFL
jgi:hypothetical protein